MADAAPTTNPSRRLFLAAGSAGALFGALSAAAAEQDPIFAAIERHKEAEIAYCDGTTQIDEVVAKEEGREITEADEAAFDVIEADAEAALEVLLATVPLTVAGARAALEYVAKIDWTGEQLVPFVATLLKSPVLAGGEA